MITLRTSSTAAESHPGWTRHVVRHWPSLSAKGRAARPVVGKSLRRPQFGQARPHPVRGTSLMCQQFIVAGLTQGRIGGMERHPLLLRAASVGFPLGLPSEAPELCRVGAVDAAGAVERFLRTCRGQKERGHWVGVRNVRAHVVTSIDKHDNQLKGVCQPPIYGRKLAISGGVR